MADKECGIEERLKPNKKRTRGGYKHSLKVNNIIVLCCPPEELYGDVVIDWRPEENQKITKS